MELPELNYQFSEVEWCDRMTSQLTKAERETALFLTVFLAVAGTVLALIGRNDLLGVHGVLLAVSGYALTFFLMKDQSNSVPIGLLCYSYFPTRPLMQAGQASVGYGQFIPRVSFLVSAATR